MRIEDALTKFITQLQADGRSDHTIGQYRRHIGVLAAWIARERHGVDLDQLDHQDVAAFLNAPTARHRGDGSPKRANTMNALRTSLRCFFAFAHAAGWTPQNPSRLLRRAICSPAPPRAMSEDEVGRLLHALKHAKGTAARRDHALFAFMIGTGVRLSSALALRVEDVDLDRSEVTLHNAKGGRNDVVFLGRKARIHMARYLGDRRDGVVFPGPNGYPLSRRHAHRRFVGWLRDAGIHRRLSPHSCRHSFATRLYSQTGDIFLVKSALHHRNIASTLVYAETDDHRLRELLG